MSEAKQRQHLEATRRYYDAFSARYDHQRGGRVPGGYHDLVDELEIEFVRRFGEGQSILEVGCGTGLILEQLCRFSSQCIGIDLSPGMLAHARERGLEVCEASAESLPFNDDRFDVTCSFKVLAHVQHIEATLREILRVTRPGGTAILEFYNRHSLRAWVKRLTPSRPVSDDRHEGQVFTRFDSPEEIAAMLPPGCYIAAARGVRIVTPLAQALQWPLVGPLFADAERRLCDGPLARFGGFWIVAIRKAAR